jgi:diguanylate cyclase (GGDEF)-like protein/PAS domain S-box-containing protein
VRCDRGRVWFLTRVRQEFAGFFRVSTRVVPSYISVRNRGIVKRRARPVAKRAQARPSAKRAGQDLEGEIQERRKALADLMHSQVLGQADISRAFNQITETASHVLGVERASVWRLADSGAAIECIDLYERSQARHSAGVRISAADAPRYFAALQRERAIRAHDARTDPRTKEFRKGYLEPLGITSMLDAPVFLRGKMVGVVCHEHTGRRREWKLHEELLASSFADFVALVLETAAWHEAKEALRQERDALETTVAERTRALQESEASLRALIDYSPIAIVLTRIRDHKVVLANRRAAALFEVPLDGIKERSAPDHWVDATDRGRYLERLRRFGRVDDMDVQLLTRAGRPFWARVSGQVLKFDGEDTLLATVIDITEQRLTQENLRELATHDPLTGVFNRRHVEDVLRKELDRAERHDRPLAVAMMDADHFKNINDTYGHQTGDEVLRAISGRCQKTLRSHDVLGRYGGEEFVVVFPETSIADAAVVAERLRAAVAENPIKVGSSALAVTVSIGLAAFTRGQDLEKLFRRADSALYAAKQDGRNLVRA